MTGFKSHNCAVTSSGFGCKRSTNNASYQKFSLLAITLKGQLKLAAAQVGQEQLNK